MTPAKGQEREDADSQHRAANSQVGADTEGTDSLARHPAKHRFFTSISGKMSAAESQPTETGYQ